MLNAGLRDWHRELGKSSKLFFYGQQDRYFLAQKPSIHPLPLPPS